MPTQAITIRATPNGLKAFLPDGTELASVDSITISANADDVVTTIIRTREAAIEPLTVDATIIDITLTSICQQIRNGLQHIASRCHDHAKARHHKHVHTPSAILSEHLIAQVNAMEKTLKQAEESPSPQIQPLPTTEPPALIQGSSQ